MRKISLIFFTLLAGIGARAQFYNSGVFYVSSGTMLSTGGSFTNTASAAYQNDGSVYISGNISNDQPSLPAGGGTTYFNGVTAQTLSGSAAFRCLNITLSNAAGLTLSDRLAIGDGAGGILTFSSGEITTGGNTQDVYFYPGSSYAGFDASHHIIGYTTKSGATDFTFPIGDGLHMADLDLTGLSAAADFQVLYTGSGFGTYNTNGTLNPSGVFNQEWWNIAQTAGSASAQVTLKWDDARKILNHSSPSGLVVAHFSSGAWQSAGGTSSSPAGSPTGIVGPSNALSSFSPFTFGSTSTPLPILLSAFTVVDKDCQAYLSWITSFEQNAASFDVQQSTDGTNFTTVTSVRADDTASEYHVSIAQSVRQAFYRLRLVDLDGQYHYSGIDELSLSCIPSADRLALYPNPLATGSSLQVKFTSPLARGQGQLQVFDEVGRRVYIALVTVNAGDNLYTVPATGMAQGIYTVILIGEGWTSDAVPFTRSGH
jgi:hypothetical protein